MDTNASELSAAIGAKVRSEHALGIGLQALVAVPQIKPVKVVRGGEAPAVWTGQGGGRGMLLAGTTPPDILELWDWTLAPGDRHDSEAHAQGTKEILQVREGMVTVVVGDQSEVLEVDDAASFTSDVPHFVPNSPAPGFVVGVIAEDRLVHRPHDCTVVCRDRIIHTKQHHGLLLPEVAWRRHHPRPP